MHAGASLLPMAALKTLMTKANAEAPRNLEGAGLA